MSIMMSGNAKTLLLNNDMDVGVYRPFVSTVDGQSYWTKMVGNDAAGTPQYQNVLMNTQATILDREWVTIDRVLLEALKAEVKVYGELIQLPGLRVKLPNAMSTIMLQHSKITKSGNATVSMDGLRKAERDRSLYESDSMPIPIIHSDFSFTLRELLVSRKTGNDLDTIQMEESAYQCGIQLEDMTLGNTTAYSYNGKPVYGFMNHPDRFTGTITSPASGGWTPATLKNEILTAFQTLRDSYYSGPFGIYMAPAWDKYLGDDYSAVYPGLTLEGRLDKIGKIQFMRTAERISGYQIIIFELKPRTVRCLDGLPFKPLQWDSEGGMAIDFKLFGIQVPQIRSNAEGKTGVMHLSTA